MKSFITDNRLYLFAEGDWTRGLLNCCVCLVVSAAVAAAVFSNIFFLKDRPHMWFLNGFVTLFCFSLFGLVCTENLLYV